MIDLRTASLNIKPKQTKHKDFNLSLADYLNKELRKRGLKTSKLNDLAVRVHVGEPEEFKYHSFVIDCLDGNMYVIDKRNKERRVGKLLAFKGTRSSDAFHCLNKSIYKILRKLNVYTIINELKKESEVSIMDLRKNNKITISDLRKKNIIVSDLRKRNIVVSDLRVASMPTVYDLRQFKKQKTSLLNNILLSFKEIKNAKEEVSYDSDTKSFVDKTINAFHTGLNMIKRLLGK